MSAMFIENPDTSFSLHFQKEELSVLIALLSIVEVSQFANKKSKAVVDIRASIESVLGTARVKKIWEDDVVISLDNDENDDEYEWGVYFGPDND